MAMHDGAGHPINPANLWGKPDPRKPLQKTKEPVVSRNDNDDVLEDNDDIDVDAELGEDIADDAAAIKAAGEYQDDDYENEFAPEAGDDDSPDDELEEEVDADEPAVAAEADDGADDDESDDETDAVSEDESEDEPATDALPAATNSRKREMANKKTSLSDHIRAEIARRQEAGDSLRGKDIVAGLARRHVEVSAAQVSQILKKEGLSSGRAGRPKAEKAAASADGQPSRQALKVKGKTTQAKKPAVEPRVAPRIKPAVSGSAQLPMEQLQAANAFVKACGNSFETATQILGLAEQISQTFTR